MSMRSLLLPFWWTTKNRFFPPGEIPAKPIFMGVFSITLCTVIYLVSCKVVGYFHSQNELGIILSLKIFQMSWIILFAMLVFSCMVSAVSSLFLSQDNEILYSSPLSASHLFFMRYVTTAIYTSWMMILFSLPVYFAYGSVFSANFPYTPLMITAVVCTAAIANCFGLLVTIPLVNLFPARRTKDIILYLFLCFGLFFYIIFRLMRPEDMMNPDKFGHFVDYLSSISTPAAPYVPAAWAANLLSLYLLDHQVDWLLLALLVITPFALFILGEWAMRKWFFSGYSKAQESFGGYRRFISRTTKGLSAWRWFINKEAKLFLRDSSEWAQLFMIGALVVVYLYNFKFLPVERSPFAEEFVTNIVSFLNIGLVGFIITSLAARFVYPSIGAEGGAFTIIQKAPITMHRFLTMKFLFYVIPFTILSLFLVITSDHLLRIEGPMWWISVSISTVITWSIIGLALGFGSLYADYKAENRAAALGGMGAILFLFTALTLMLIILVPGSIPAYRLTIAGLRNTEPNTRDLIFLTAWFLASISFALWLSVFLIQKGIRKLSETE